eukprot:4983844-Pyramimonas_sp.AAC.1
MQVCKQECKYARMHSCARARALESPSYSQQNFGIEAGHFAKRPQNCRPPGAAASRKEIRRRVTRQTLNER